MLTLSLVTGTIVFWISATILHLRRISKGVNISRDEEISQAVAAQGWSDAGLLELTERYPLSALPLSRWAVRKVDEEKWGEALRRGNVLREKFPKVSAGHVISIKALIKLGQLDDAERTIQDTIRAFPQDREPLVLHCELAVARHDWSEVQRHSMALIGKFPKLSGGYQWGAIAFCELGQLPAADKLLQKGIQELGPLANREVLILYGDLAHRQGDWSELLNRCVIIRTRLDNEPYGYWRGAEALRLLGRTQEAASVIETAMVMFPTQSNVLQEFAKHGRGVT